MVEPTQTVIRCMGKFRCPIALEILIRVRGFSAVVFMPRIATAKYPLIQNILSYTKHMAQISLSRHRSPVNPSLRQSNL
jgi:hypothetical protein